ncbi:PREDICTED: uncharacterized protein LOC108616103 isoform X1 [Drosophila arizonae]|uniref:Uncharacterized protein LOC108616103 isoform X1 n=1 Tax=Drosophila arizonae TaxID=7263 RepID=A0ABM1PH72_DROAR|nr:PREDICTED: uncharacterized protein LOC108616103 isoform X1 [Drosophila arizonae]
MWEQLERYRNHFLQREMKGVMKSSTVNCLQSTEWDKFRKKRDCCLRFPQQCAKSSTYFIDRAQLAYGYFALPKLMKEIDSDVNLTHWRAIVSLTEFLLNPQNVQRAVLEMDIVRKLKNAFMRKRLKYHAENFEEIETYLKIFNIISRNLNGAEQIANRKCLMIEFYKILKDMEPRKEDLAAEILRNLTGKPKVLGIVLSDAENLTSIANYLKQDPCKPLYPPDMWHHLCHMLEVAPEQGIQLGLFQLLHSRIVNRLAKFWEMNCKAFALLLRCSEGQRLFDEVDGIKMIFDIFEDKSIPAEQQLHDQPVLSYEYIVLALLNGLHSKRALWRMREFTLLICHVGRAMHTRTNARLQLYCLKALRAMGVMPCNKRYIIGNWLDEISALECYSADAECARDALLDWLRRDIADNS